MIRPPFRPPLYHEPGTSADATPNPREQAPPGPKAGTKTAEPPCCGRPGCCESAARREHGATRANSPDLNSVAPAPSPPKRGPAAPGRAHSN